MSGNWKISSYCLSVSPAVTRLTVYRRLQVRALSWLNMSLIGPWKDSKWSGNVSKTCQNFDENWKIDVFLKSSQINPEPFLHQKNTILTQKTMILKSKIPWCEALSLTIAIGPAFGWFWGSPRYCMILTLWPYTFDRNTRQINKSLDITSELH